MNPLNWTFRELAAATLGWVTGFAILIVDHTLWYVAVPASFIIPWLFLAFTRS
jgi:hypothetical protein